MVATKAPKVMAIVRGGVLRMTKIKRRTKIMNNKIKIERKMEMMMMMIKGLRLWSAAPRTLSTRMRTCCQTG